jgi:TRAP-type C4-dicarboxylate transport system permease small subunit
VAQVVNRQPSGRLKYRTSAAPKRKAINTNPRMQEQTAFSISASVLGLVSAIYFCIGSALSSSKRITEQSSTFWFFNEPLARSLSAQRAQYVTGALTLLLSFGLQIAATLASTTNLVNLPQFFHTWQYFALAVLVATALATWLFCAYLTKATTKKVLGLHQAQAQAESNSA